MKNCVYFLVWCVDRVSNFPFVVLSGVACYVDREQQLTTVDGETKNAEDFSYI